MSDDRVYIIGVGITLFGRHVDRTVADLTGEAVARALADAGAETSDVEAAWFANTRQGIFEFQHGIRGQCALRPLGFEGLPIFNTDNACASSTAAFNQAVAYVRAGMARVALVVGAEKMNYPEQRDLMERAFTGSMDQQSGVQEIEEFVARSTKLDMPVDAQTAMGGHSIFMDYYAARARLHMNEFGTTERQLAEVASKNHWHAQWNEQAQYRNQWSVDEVLRDKPIVWPLTRSMCAPMTDGASAIVVCGDDALGRFDRRRAVRVLASQLVSGTPRPNEGEQSPLRIAASRAYQQAGIGPEGVSVAEVHDATAFAEIRVVEELDFVAQGEGGGLAEQGISKLGGRLPINVSGGLLSRGHPTAATGGAQLHHLTTQLRSEAGPAQVEGARIGLAQNGGGFYNGDEAIVAVTMLGAPELV